ncbi:hypothetical protein SBADM41S_06308 [Streptomyces badius]
MHDYDEGEVEPGHIAIGGNGDEDRNATRRFLSVLGQHPDAYAAVATAEQAYIRSVLETHVGADGIDSGAARATVRAGAMTCTGEFWIESRR